VVFFTERSNSTSRHPHQFVGRVAIHASPPSIIANAVGMRSGVATRAACGGWPDGWLVAKGLRRDAAVVVPCGLATLLEEGSSQSTRGYPVRGICSVTVVTTPSLEPGAVREASLLRPRSNGGA